MTLARTAGTSASASKSSRYRTSTARSAEPSGVRNTADMPAATPATISTRRSRVATRRIRPTVEPIAAPICMVGPRVRRRRPTPA